MNFSLAHKIFLAFTLMLLAVLGLAVAVTYFKGQEIARQTVDATLQKSRDVQETLERLRFQELSLISEIFASDPYFSSYVAEATGDDLGLDSEVDSASIVDLLQERQQELGFDFALVLDPYGEVITDTNNDEMTGTDLSADPAVEQAIESLESMSNYWIRGEQLYQIAVVPLADQQDLVGFLLTALVVSNDFVNDIKNTSGADIVFVKDIDGAQVLASTLDQEELEFLFANKALLLSASGNQTTEVSIDNDTWLASVSMAGVSESTGQTIALTSVDDAVEHFNALQKLLLIASAVSILLALPISFAVTKGVTAPIRKLANAAQAAARGDYQQSFETRSGDEIAGLTNAFDSLLSDLREKNDMQEYLADLARHVPATSEDKTTTGATLVDKTSNTVDDFTLVGLELRHFARKTEGQSADDTLNLFNTSLNNIESLAAAFNGQLIGVVGHTAMFAFSGMQSCQAATSFAAKALQSLLTQSEKFAAAIVKGQAFLGTSTVSDKTITSCVGNSVYQLERLLREAKPGYLFIAPAVYEFIKQHLPEFKPVASTGMVTKSKFYSLPAAQADIFDDEDDEQTLVQVTSFQSTQIAGEQLAQGKTLHVTPGMSLGGRYQILAELGAGGMGVVYKAHDTELDEIVALKMLRITDNEHSSAFLEAMKSEIRLARKITHPSVIRTHDYGELDGFPYISMEFIRGLTLKHLLEQNTAIPYSAGLQIAKQLAAGLGAAHAEGVLHRDIKSENIIIDFSGNAKLMDFGIARQVSGSGLGELEGSVIGTPRYASPEQLQGLELDERTDIYSAGILLYQMFTKKFPHKGKRFDAIVKAKLENEPIKPSEYWPEIPAELEQLILECISKDPADRIKNADTLLERLELLRA